MDFSDRLAGKGRDLDQINFARGSLLNPRHSANDSKSEMSQPSSGGTVSTYNHR